MQSNLASIFRRILAIAAVYSIALALGVVVVPNLAEDASMGINYSLFCIFSSLALIFLTCSYLLWRSTVFLAFGLIKAAMIVFIVSILNVMLFGIYFHAVDPVFEGALMACKELSNDGGMLQQQMECFLGGFVATLFLQLSLWLFPAGVTIFVIFFLQGRQRKRVSF